MIKERDYFSRANKTLMNDNKEVENKKEVIADLQANLKSRQVFIDDTHSMTHL